MAHGVQRPGGSSSSRPLPLILAGLILSAAYVVGWLMTIGMSLPLAVGMFLLIAIVYLVTVKLIAATGFAYLFPTGRI